MEPLEPFVSPIFKAPIHKPVSKHQKVSDVAQAELGFFERLGNRATRTLAKGGVAVGQFLYRNELAKHVAEARAFLMAHVIDIEQIDQKLPPHLDGIIRFLRQMGAPISSSEVGGDPQSSRKLLITSILWIVIGNLAKQVIQENEAPISLNALTDRILQYLIDFFGENFNHIESQHPDGRIPQEEFIPMSNALLAQILPIEGLIIDKIKPYASLRLVAVYESIQKMISGEPSEGKTDLTDIKPLLHSVNHFVLKSYVNQSLEGDQIKLAKLTGKAVEEISQWTKSLSEEAHQLLGKQMIEMTAELLPHDPALMQTSVQALLTKLCLHAAENIQQGAPRSVEELLKVVQENLQNNQNIAWYLTHLMLPQDAPYMHAFAERYANHFMPLMNNTWASLLNFLQAQPQILNETKDKLCAKVRNVEPLISLFDRWNAEAVSIAGKQIEKSAESSLLMQAGLKLAGGFEEQIKMAMKTTLWKVFVQMIPEPLEGAQWDSSEVFAKVLDRLHEFAHENVRQVTDALKEENDENKRLLLAKELSLPLLRAFIQSFVSQDLQGEIPLPEQFRPMAVQKIEEILNGLIAEEFVKATKRSLKHPEEPELADAIFTMQKQTDTAQSRIDEAKESLNAKISHAAPLIRLIDEQVNALSVMGAEKAMTLGATDQFSVEELKWVGEVGQPIETIIKGWVWKLIATMIPHPVDGNKFSLEETLPKIFEGFEQFADDHFPHFLKEAVKIKEDPVELLKQSKPVLQAFVRRFISEQIAVDIPVPAIYQKKVAGMMEDLLLEMLRDPILRYVENAHREAPAPYPVIRKYQPFLPLDIQKALEPYWGEDVNNPQMIGAAKAQLIEKIEDPDSVLYLVDRLSEKAAVLGAEKGLQILSEKLHMAAGRSLFNPLQKPMEALIKGLIWKIFARLIPASPDGKKFPSNELLKRVLDHLVQFADGRFSHMMENMKKDWNDLSKELRKERALQLTQPVLKEFLQTFISDDLAGEFPLPEDLRNHLTAQIEQSLNDYMAEALVASCSWMAERKDNEAVLDQMFQPQGLEQAKSSAPVKACHAAGKLIEAMLPYQCRENHGVWAQEAFNAVKDLLPMDEQGQNAASTGMKIVDAFLKYIGACDSPEVKTLLGFMSEYAETALLKLVRQLGTRIQKLDEALVEGETSHLEKALELLMKELQPHLRAYGNHRKLFRKGDQKKILEAFRKEGLLHRAMEDEKAKLAVFQTWSAKFLALAGLHSGEPLPVPSFFKEVAWDKLQVSLLPAMLLLAFEKMKDPQILDQVVRIGLEKISGDWNREKVAMDHIREAFFPEATAGLKPKAPVVRQFDDPYQKKLEERVGRLGHLVLRMESSPFLSKVMRLKGMQQIVGQVAGQPLRGNLREHSADPAVPGKAVRLNEVLGATLEAFVDHFMPCEKVEGKWNYFVHDENGQILPEGRAEPDFVELCPKTAQEKQDVHLKEVQRRAALQRDVAKGVSRVIKDQLNMQLQSLANLPWDTFVNGFVRMLRAIVRSKHKDKVEMSVRKFFWFLRRYIIFPVLAVITLPIWLPVRESINAIMAKKGKNQIDSLKKEIHLNLAFRVVDELLHKLELGMRAKAGAA